MKKEYQVKETELTSFTLQDTIDKILIDVEALKKFIIYDTSINPLPNLIESKKKDIIKNINKLH